MYAYAPPNGYDYYAEPRKIAFQSNYNGRWLCAKHGGTLDR